MKLSIREKKVLYDFACPNHHNTVTRLKWLTALTVLCLDYAQNGIGSESCGPRLLEKYRLNDADFDFSLRLIPSLPTKE